MKILAHDQIFMQLFLKYAESATYLFPDTQSALRVFVIKKVSRIMISRLYHRHALKDLYANALYISWLDMLTVL
jgi:hypothetical protein